MKPKTEQLTTPASEIYSREQLIDLYNRVYEILERQLRSATPGPNEAIARNITKRLLNTPGLLELNEEDFAKAVRRASPWAPLRREK